METRRTGMKRRFRWSATVSAAVLPGALLCGAGDLPAQTIWTGLERPKGLQLELHHPELDDFGPEAYGALTSVGFIGGRLPVSPMLNVVADVPLAYADADVPSDPGFDASKFGIGAPYLGAEYVPGTGMVFEGGVRLPIASENLGASVGSSSEFVDRLGAFSDYAVVVNAAGLFGGSADRFAYRIRFGPRALIATEEDTDTELLLDYGGVLGYDAPTFGVEAGVVGLAILTEGDVSFGERTLHEAGVQAYRNLSGGGRLGLLARFPLDEDLRELQDLSVGLITTIPID